MPMSDAYSFQRYLEAKKGIDDRSLNRVVWERLQAELQNKALENRLCVLEIGAGIGTMFERLVDWGLFTQVKYTAIDLDSENIRTAQQRVAVWGKTRGYQTSYVEGGMIFTRGDQRLELYLEAANLYDFIEISQQTNKRWDLLVAHAFLDLVDIPNTLPGLFSLLAEDGLYYFTLNFDGVTIFEPILNAGLDEKVISFYHRSMDERATNGKPSGDSLSGRHLFFNLERSGSEILASGASDWVVYPVEGRYQAEEGYFLHAMIETINQELEGHPELAGDELARWVERRHEQIDSGELVFIAHQLDFVGQVSHA